MLKISKSAKTGVKPMSNSLQPLSEQLERTELRPSRTPAGKQAVVSPRAFLSEIGYNVEGEQIPKRVAQLLLDREPTRHIADLIRTFSDEFHYDFAGASDMFRKQGFVQMSIYRLDGHKTTDERIEQPALESFAEAGYLVCYHPYGETKANETGHEQSGYFTLPQRGYTTLVTDLLTDDSDADAFSFSPDRDRTANHESWGVLRYRDGIGSKTVKQRYDDNLLFSSRDGDVPPPRSHHHVPSEPQ